MKNHEWVDGKLLQTNKKYSHLKLKQKEKIYQWMYESYRAKREELGRFPDSKDTDDVLEPVMAKIEEAQIWIPYSEVAKHYRSVVSNLRKRYNREQMGKAVMRYELEPLDVRFSVCKVADYSGIDTEKPYCFIGCTDEEKSLVCPINDVPDNATERDDGWRCFRICGKLDFSLIGILAHITKILASNQIGVFAISTFNTDYVLTKEDNFEKALAALKNAGYIIRERDDISIHRII